MKKLAIIGAGRAALDYVINAKEMGIETHCFAWKKGAIAAEEADYFHDISIFEKERILDICKKIGIGGVVATTELTISIASYIAESMNLNGNPLNVSEVITDKYRNRKVSADVEGLNHPRYAEVTTKEEIEQLDFEFPIILKPTNKGGKRGITVVRNREDINVAYQYAISEVGEDTKLIVEEFIEGGQEYSVESLSFHGKHYIIQVTQKISSGPPHCVELGHFQPADLSNEMRKQIDIVMKKALQAIGIGNGPCHTEIKVRDNKIYLIEFNARPGGDRISHPLTMLSTGYPYFKGMIKVAFDESPDVHPDNFTSKAAGIWFITEQTKELKPIFEVCQNYEWCYEKQEKTDEISTLLHNSGSSINYFIYCSEQKPDFKKLINQGNS